MKRFINILAFIALISVSFSCTPEEAKPIAEFKEKILNLHATQSVDVTVELDKAAVEPISIAVEYLCNSNAYNTTGKSFDFAVGESSSTLTVTDLNLPAGESITMKLTPSDGVEIGTNYICVITKDAAETLIYNFSESSTDLVSEGIAKVSLTLTGLYSGNKFRAAEDMTIPVVIEGAGKDYVRLEEGVTGFTVAKGTNTATLKLLTTGEFTEESSATLKIGAYEGATLSAGEVSSVTINLTSYLNPSALTGTWEFSHIYEVEELVMWFEEYGDDPELLPINNEGFTLTFSEGENGTTLTPGGEGDFGNFFRTTSITLTEPYNLVAYGEVSGDYTAKESNMFQATSLDSGDKMFNSTFFKLAQANRAFSPDTETLGEAAISLRLTEEGNLELTIRDYDCPPFGELWWTEGDFDPEMFGFCCVFTKAE